jgi:phosphatidylglycerol lysyltransferase
VNRSDAPRSQRRMTFLQALVDAPGRLSHWVSGRTTEMPRSPLERSELAAMVRASPRANGVLSLERDLRVFGDQKGAITFAGSGRTAFACGGIHGPETTHVLRAFTDSLATSGYRRALLFPIGEEERTDCREGGFPSVRAGMEAFIKRDDYSLRGKRYVDLRQMLNRATKRHNLQAWEVHPPVGREALESIHREWLLERPTWTPMALVVGSPSLNLPLGRRYFAVGDAESKVPCAFISLASGWNGSGWGVDVMARNPSAPAGAMELVISEAMTTLFDEEAAFFSLGAAPLFSGPSPQLRPTHPLERAMGWIYASRLANRFFHFNALARFKMKFAPSWVPVYIGLWPRPSIRALYGGCRMWGLFGSAHLDPIEAEPLR